MKYNQIVEKDLKILHSIVSADRISTGQSNRELHSRDESNHPPSLPEVVIWPDNSKEVVEILKYANNRSIPLTAWGAGSSLEGNPIPVNSGIVLDFSQMNRILNIREEDFQADVEPGVVYKNLNEKLRYKGLFFPPDPGAGATIGGMIANNASGTRTVKYGSTKDHILKLSVVLANGELIEIGTRSSKSSSGYDLVHLFVGSEGTLGLVVKATVRLVGLPVEFSVAIVTFPSVKAAGKAVFEIIKSGLDPAMLELLGPECIVLINKEKDLGLNVSPTLFMEYHGPSQKHLAEIMNMVKDICEGEGASNFIMGLDRDKREHLIKTRHEMHEMIRRNHPDCSNFTIDVAVPITAYPEIIATAEEERVKAGLPAYIFSHAGDGNLHFVFQPRIKVETDMEIISQVNHRMVSKALSLGGTATGEHGVGIGKRKFMEAEHGKSLEWMKRIKQVFDPMGILNPGKIFP